MTSNEMNNTKETIISSKKSSEPVDCSGKRAPAQQNGALGAIMKNYKGAESDSSDCASQSSETSQVTSAEAKNDAGSLKATLESSSSSLSSVSTDPAETATPINVTVSEYRVNADASSDSESDDTDDDDSADDDISAVSVKKPTLGQCGDAKPQYGCSEAEPPVPDISLLKLEPGLEFVHAGDYFGFADTLITIHSVAGVGPFDSETPLFLDTEGTPLGFIFDIIGPVKSPFYVVKFNTYEEIVKLSLIRGQKVYAAPKSVHTKYVFLPDIIKHKGSDASWVGDSEVPQELQEYSDDEKEFVAKHGRPTANTGKRGFGEAAPRPQGGELVEGSSAAPSIGTAESKTNQFQKRSCTNNYNNNNNYRRRPETRRAPRNIQFRDRQHNPPRIHHNPPFAHNSNDLMNPVAIFNPSIPPPMHPSHSGNVFIPQQPHCFTPNYQNYIPLPPFEFRSPPPQNFSWQSIHNGQMQYPPQGPVFRSSFYPHMPAVTISNTVGPFRPPQFAQNPPSPGPAAAYITVPPHSISPGPRFGPMPNAGLPQGYICSVPAVNPSSVSMPVVQHMGPHVQHIPLQLPPQGMEAPNGNSGATSGRYR